MTSNVSLKEKVLPAFYNSWKQSEKFIFNVEKGGRGSGKSSYIAQKIIVLMMKHKVNTLAVRKVANTLKDSVREQLIWAIEDLQVQDYWHYTHVSQGSPDLVYNGFDNRIVFRGADDPAKIKSLTDSKYPFAILWVEELVEFRTEDEIDTIIDSVVREEIDSKYYVFFSYNPPKQKHHWCNKKYNTVTIPADTVVHSSTYLDNKYIGRAALNRINDTKKRNLNKYKWLYLGEAIGGGIVPFSNLQFRNITDEEIKTFDNVREGIDWGYAADPVSWGKMHYDKTRRILYVYDEVYGVQISNRRLKEMIRHKVMIIADSAEPKSIAEMKSYGIKIKGAKKGPGSVEYGEKWLDDLEAIIIDPIRCPNTAREFESADYDVDRNGNMKNRIVDKDNHTIDMMRYALEEEMKSKIGFGFLK